MNCVCHVEIFTVLLPFSAPALISAPHDRACSELSNGGFGLKIGPFLTKIRPILQKFQHFLHR